MKKIYFCVIITLLLAFPISGMTSVLKNDVRVKGTSIADRGMTVQLTENAQSEDDPATDDGEDLRDGDSDSNSNEDSDKDNG